MNKHTQFFYFLDLSFVCRIFYIKKFFEYPLQRLEDQISELQDKYLIPPIVYQTWENNLFGKTHFKQILKFRKINHDLTFLLFDKKNFLIKNQDIIIFFSFIILLISKPFNMLISNGNFSIVCFWALNYFFLNQNNIKIIPIFLNTRI